MSDKLQIVKSINNTPRVQSTPTNIWSFLHAILTSVVTLITVVIALIFTTIYALLFTIPGWFCLILGTLIYFYYDRH